MSLRARTPVACRIAGITPEKMNEAIKAKDLDFVPPTTSGAARVFGADSEFLRADFTAQYEHGWLELRHTIVPRADHIPAQACADSLRELDPFRESLQYQLLRRRRGEGFTEEVADR